LTNDRTGFVLTFHLVQASIRIVLTPEAVAGLESLLNEARAQQSARAN
jgi:hypothetical protein